MKTIKTVSVTYKRVLYIPETIDMEEGVIYISDEYKTAAHLCLCGCKELTILPLTKGEWSYTIDKRDVISMSPSVGNYQLPCKSHYIITKGGANFV